MFMVLKALCKTMAVFLMGASISARAASDAEFAVRWDASTGGPQSLDETMVSIGMKDGKFKEAVVSYFTIAQPTTAPTLFAVIGRERVGPKERDATFKIRGTEPLPAALSEWNCPWTTSIAPKREVDISWTGEASPKRSISLSCTAEQTSLTAVLPGGYVATAQGCSSKMQRQKAKEITIERWSLAQGRVVFEVSMKGKDTASDLSIFKKTVVVPLLKKGVVPISSSKTELGSQC